MSDDDKGAVDQVLDLVVYAPLGLLFEVRDLLPRMAERGRQQASLARMIGQFAVTKGRHEAGRTVGRVREQVGGAFPRPGGSERADDGASAVPDAIVEAVLPQQEQEIPVRVEDQPAVHDAGPQGTDGPLADAGPLAEAGGSTGAAPVEPAGQFPPQRAVAPSEGASDEAEPDVAAAPELAIPDYDTLSASQVVPRLAGLSPSELEAVRAHEAAGRARKTILNRITQLQTPSS